MLLRRIVLLYIVLLLCRIVFYCYNYALIGPLGWQEVLTLAGGGLKFDTVSVVYADGVFILLYRFSTPICFSSSSRCCRSISGSGAGIGVFSSGTMR